MCMKTKVYGERRFGKWAYIFRESVQSGEI